MTVTSAVGSSAGHYDTFTFTPSKGGKQKVYVSVSKEYGASHTIRTIVYKGTVDKLATISNSESATVSLTAGQYYTVKVQMVSPSYYTTTTYSYKVTVDPSSGGSPSSTPSVNTPKASKGTYAGYVRITWSKSSGSPSGYRIMRGTSSTFSKATLLTKVSSSTTSYNDTSAAAGKTYYYWVCPIKGNTYYYNTSKYATGYRKKGSSSSSSSSSSSTYGSISGPSSLKKNATGYYYLYVGGKKITSSSVVWKKSGSYGTVYDAGYYGRLYAGNPAKSGVTTKITAKYNGKTYSKTVKLLK